MPTAWSAVAWIISSFMAALAGVLLAPVYGDFNSDEFVTLTVTAIAAAAWAMLRSLPIAAGVAVLIGVVTTVLQGYIPPDSFWNAAVVPSLPFFAIAAALLILPGMRNLDSSRDPLATIDPPPAPIAATARAPSMDRIIRTAWWVLLAAFCVSMLTWIPVTWEGVFNNGLALSIMLPLGHVDHRHGGPAVAVPGDLCRDRRLHGRRVRRPPRAQLPGRRPHRRAPSPPSWRWCWRSCRCACVAWDWR